MYDLECFAKVLVLEESTISVCSPCQSLDTDVYQLFIYGSVGFNLLLSTHIHETECERIYILNSLQNHLILYFITMKICSTKLLSKMAAKDKDRPLATIAYPRIDISYQKLVYLILSLV